MPLLHHAGWLLLALTAGVQASETTTIRLNTSLEDPYQVVVDGQLSGSSVDVLQCIFKRLQQPYQIQLTSLNRAQQNVSRQVADGFFSSAPNSQLDSFAQLSAPLLVEKWYWYALDPATLNRPIWDENLRIGSVLGSNSLAWLESRAIHIEQKVPHLEQLVAMLQRGRINMLLADSTTMQNTRQQLDSQQPLLKRFVRYSPLGVYFSLSFLKQHPDFLKAFNRQVEDCAPASISLSSTERKYLKQLLKSHLHNWAKQPKLLAALRRSIQRGNSAARIQELDRQWRQERLLEEKPLIRRTLSNPQSQRLIAISKQYAPLFNEIYVSDSAGQTIAMSVATSDYWQADEIDFQTAAGLDQDEVYLSAIEYDGSTQSFQSKASAPLYDPENGKLLGVISLGINIDRAFSDNLSDPALNKSD